AECGGAMYTGAGIEDAEGRRHRLAGLWPGWTSLTDRRLSVGYRQVRALSPNFLYPVDLPAHEFHHSKLRRSRRSWSPAWEVEAGAPTGADGAPLGVEAGASTGADGAPLGVVDRGGQPEGCASARLTASYVHLHLGSRPGLASAF